MTIETIPATAEDTAVGGATPDVSKPESIRNAFPAVDIYETEESYVLLAEVPGVAQGDVQIRLQEDTLHLEAVARTVHLSSAIHRQHDQVKYTRDFNIGRGIDHERIEADLRHGVLRVTLHKAQAAQPKQIEVRAS